MHYWYTPGQRLIVRLFIILDVYNSKFKFKMFVMEVGHKGLLHVTFSSLITSQKMLFLMSTVSIKTRRDKN